MFVQVFCINVGYMLRDNLAKEMQDAGHIMRAQIILSESKIDTCHKSSLGS